MIDLNKFDYRRRSRELLADGEVDPFVIADKIVAEMTPEQAHWALRSLMPGAVREVVRSGRSHKGFRRSKPEEPTEQGRLPVYTAAGWGPMGELDYQGCLDQARMYRERAGANLARAEEFEHWAELLHERGGKLADLEEWRAWQALGTQAYVDKQARGLMSRTPYQLTSDQISHIIFWSMETGRTVDQIARKINVLGWKSPSGEAWTTASLYRVLNNDPRWMNRGSQEDM